MRHNPIDRRGAVIYLVSMLWVVGLCACGRGIDPSADSESHWLRACETDGDCGTLGCLCGLCSVTCDSEDACGGMGIPALCQAPETRSVACDDIPASTPICIPDCSAAVCDSETQMVRAAREGEVLDDPSSSEISVPSTRIELPKVAPVPACPEVARTTGLPAVFFTTEVEEYDGTATVTEVTNENVVLTANDRTDTQFLLRFRRAPPAFLPQGLRVAVLVRSGGEDSAAYTLLVVRDDGGRLLLAYHEGADRLYQDGLFATPTTLGATLGLRMICQSAVDDGDSCFENQVQADYEGILEGDSRVTTDEHGVAQVGIEGEVYAVVFHASSVDGGARRADCNPDITPNRYLSFSLSAPW